MQIIHRSMLIHKVTTYMSQLTQKLKQASKIKVWHSRVQPVNAKEEINIQKDNTQVAIHLILHHRLAMKV